MDLTTLFASLLTEVPATAAVVLVLMRILPSATSKNDLITIGNKFVDDLLEQSRKEREILREIILQLEEDRQRYIVEIRELTKLADEKDAQIRKLELKLGTLHTKYDSGIQLHAEDF